MTADDAAAPAVAAGRALEGGTLAFLFVFLLSLAVVMYHTRHCTHAFDGPSRALAAR